MLTYWETLIARKSNITVSDSYAKLWEKKSQSGYTVETYTGTLPATLQTVEGYLEQYKIYGNTVQDGTPTPENPIVPSGCGELETTGAHAGQYKLPLTVNGVEYPIYLGEVPTARKIKKLVLTGEENWNKRSYGNTKHTFEYTFGSRIIRGLCSHYAGYLSANIDKVDGIYLSNTTTIIITDLRFTTSADFKAYLATQYAAGTPVTVWYVLAKPETGIVNEPLMKIGDYADTIDSTQSTVQIPTAAGSTTISWAGEGLAPSEVELVYKVKG